MEDSKQDVLEQSTVQGAAAFLRMLADELEGLTGDAGPSPVAAFRKLKITLSRKSGAAALTCKITYASKDKRAVCLENSRMCLDFVKPDFAHLKKRLQRHAEAIRGRLDYGSMPAHLITGSFCHDLKLFSTYPECSELDGDEIADMCEEWQGALNRFDLTEAQETWRLIQKFLAQEAACDEQQ